MARGNAGVREEPAPMPYGAGPPERPVLTGPTPECAETEDNIEGPYYRPGAPVRSDLADPGMDGTRLTLSGRVLGPDCTTPIAGAWLDVWQADAGGHYDNDGSRGRVRSDVYVLRGRLQSDANGRYDLRTIVPGRYLNGADYRPAHIHVKLAAPGRRVLTTQLYFPGDPHNDRDPFIHRALIMDVAVDAARVQVARFDFVIG
jgi:protocatechuate 3,4-dioxygenase beta subunit